MGGLLLAETETDTSVAIGWRPGLTAVPAGATPLSTVLLELLGSPVGTPLERLIGEAAATAMEDDRPLAQIEARSLLNRLAGRGMLSARLLDGQGVAATIATPLLPDEPSEAGDALALSPDVFLRRDDEGGGGLILESAADPARRDPIEPRFAAVLLAGEPPPDWRAVLRHAGILVVRGEDRPDRRTPAGRWEFHDKLFHTRSRLWRGAARPYGATMRLAGVIEPLPGDHRPATATGATLTLPEPAQGDLAKYAEVAERRRSHRRPSAPLAVRQLGELLHRTLRVRAVRPSPAGDELDRPVPSAGALGTVGLYPLVVDCEGIDPGLYHYDGCEHALRRLEAARDADLEPLVAGARDTAGLPTEASVQVLLVLAARFGRLQYKYSGMAYAAALKDVGVVYQALYLAATAMGIGGCALGGGDALAFERASGLDRWEEGSVGEFLLTGGVR